MRRSLPLFAILAGLALLAWLPGQAAPRMQTIPQGLPAPTLATYLPLVLPALVTPTVAPTATPQLPDPSFNNCQAVTNPDTAPNYPVRITAIDKVNETVTLQNVSTSTISLTGWIMCSITGNQQHPISGSLAPGQSQTFPRPGTLIWNNNSRDDGALYTPSGRLASYWIDW